eukprot:1862323-Pyramimonas_sp.AAC.1
MEVAGRACPGAPGMEVSGHWRLQAPDGLGVLPQGSWCMRVFKVIVRCQCGRRRPAHQGCAAFGPQRLMF